MAGLAPRWFWDDELGGEGWNSFILPGELCVLEGAGVCRQPLGISRAEGLAWMDVVLRRSWDRSGTTRGV